MSTTSWDWPKRLMRPIRCARRDGFQARSTSMSVPNVCRFSLSVVDQSKRWGSCDIAGRIRLNWRLVMAPLSLVDCVIAHEVCHIPEPNHSRRFWRSLETIMPDYDDRLRRLDRMGHQFFW